MTGPPPATWAIDPCSASASEVVPGLWRLRLPLAWDGIDHVNVYLVTLADGVMLVDCGSGGDPTCLQALEHAMQATGYGIEDVRRLVVTHAHSDHAGLACTIQSASGAEIWSHPNVGHFYDVWTDPDRVAGLRARRATREGAPPDRIAAYADVREELTGVDGVYRIDRPLAAGTRVSSTLGDWEVFETPGHAPSHVSMLQRESGLMLAGDAICVAFVPWMDYGCSHDPLAESLESLDRLEQQPGVSLVLPGHGRPISDLETALALHRDGFAAELETVRELLAAGTMTGYELTERIYGVEPDFHAVNHLNEVLCLLRYLRLRGEVARDDDGNLFTYSYTGNMEAL